MSESIGNMDGVIMDRAKLLDIIKTNRDIHQSDYEDAMEGYREELEKKVKAFSRELKKAKDKNELPDPKNLYIVKPQNHLNDYDRVIRMLELGQRDEIELSNRDFQNYVLDEWAWKNEFSATTMSYSKVVNNV